MGEKYSQIRIFLADTGEEVAMAKNALVHLSPTEEQEQEPSEWSPHGYEITGTLTTTPEESEQFRKIIESMKFSRKELRKMFHAVTHGGAIVFQSYFNAEYDNGETEEFVRNVFLDEREANDACDDMNATLNVLVQPYKERIKHANGRGHKDVIVLNNKYYEQKENK